jgi:hypothetical protein
MSSGVDRRREPPRSAIASQRASPTRWRVLFCPRHGSQAFPSLCWARAEGRGLEPRASNEIGTRPPGRGGNACRSTAPAPQSKPVTHASRLVAQIAPLVAFGLQAENPGRRASHMPTLLLSRAFMWTRPQKFARARPRARGSADSSPLAGRVSHRLGRRRTIDPERDRRRPPWRVGISAHWLLSPITPGCCARTTRPSSRHSECPAAMSYKSIRSTTSAHNCSSPTSHAA